MNPSAQHVTSAEDLCALGLLPTAAAFLSALPATPAGFDHLIYCDGACAGNGRADAAGGWGLIMRSAESIRVHFGGSASTTNNKMEMTAAIEALRPLPDGARVELRTDSQYAIKGCLEWRDGWKRRGMRNVAGQPVANQELWAQLWAEVDRLSVRFLWVRGHAGEPGNEIADALSVLGLDRAKAQRPSVRRPAP